MQENLLPWIPLLLGTELIVLAAEQAYREQNRAAAIFAVFGLVSLAVMATMTGKLAAPHAPPLLSSGAADVALSIGVAFAQRYRENVLTVRQALRLTDELDDFAQMCKAHTEQVHTHIISRIELNKARAPFHDQYLNEFGKEIRRIHRLLTVRNEAFRNLLGIMLGADRIQLHQPELAAWVAKTLRNEVTLFRRTWFDKRLVWNVVTYLGIAIALWLLLFLVPHK